jgi:hypothetical protein
VKIDSCEILLWLSHFTFQGLFDCFNGDLYLRED